MWDLEAKQTGIRVWKLAGLTPPQCLTTAYTLSIDSPDNLAVEAKRVLAASLAMAPACLVAQGVPYVDLDGPLLLKLSLTVFLAHKADENIQHHDGI